jgi:hypothetical protein
MWRHQCRGTPSTGSSTLTERIPAEKVVKSLMLFTAAALSSDIRLNHKVLAVSIGHVVFEDILVVAPESRPFSG